MSVHATQVEAPPKASILIESMRDIGYSLETALADVIDNSITAGARNVHIHVDSSGPEVAIGVVDDGGGMTRSELIEAMRLGSRNPLERRREHDLGRFGLGLKTASFSQCRRLTVVVRKSGETCIAAWDLDVVSQTNQWTLLVSDDLSVIPFAKHLHGDGALVVWEKLDRTVEQIQTPVGRKHFVRRVDEAGRHLELVFHRFLTGEPGLPKVAMQLNEIPLRPFDPFHSSHPATMRGPTEELALNGHIIKITAFTLPHHRNVTAADWERYAGSAGYLKNQGFYLYREKRLIIHGTWFGLSRQTELTKLARVRIDMPNGLDAEWNVDVKKAWARPPLPVREKLQSLISTLGLPSRRIYTSRGQKLHNFGDQIWERAQEDNAIVYRLNPNSAVLSSFIEGLPEQFKTACRRTFQAVGSALPMDAIYADLASSPEIVRGERLDEEQLVEMLYSTLRNLQSFGYEESTIRHIFRATEPFRSSWEQSEPILEEALNKL